MLKKWEIGEHAPEQERTEMREKIEATLYRLQELKLRVAELKRRCEELREAKPRRVEASLRCDKCGRPVNPEKQVLVKDAYGNEKSRYHAECFQNLFK